MTSTEERLTDRVRRAILGAPRDVSDTSHLHKMSLIAFLAWVGLGADGLSSSAYGPEEAFRALGEHTYLAGGLAIATALTVLIISISYTRIIEQFPTGGGGYVVASHLLGPRAGVVSGCALVVDYVLTITVSIAGSGDAIFSFLPPGIGWAVFSHLGEVPEVSHRLHQGFSAGLTTLGLGGMGLLLVRAYAL